MNNQENNQNAQSNEVKKVENQEPIVLGELRTEKVGRPLLVLELLIIFIVVMVSLPFVNKMLDDDSSIIYKLIHGGSVVTPQTPTPVNKEYADARKPQMLNTSTSMKYDNLILKQFYLNGNKMNLSVSSYNGILNLDEKNYYLEIYSTSENKLAAFKLTGTYDNALKEVVLSSSVFNFDKDHSYKGKVVEMTLDDYPEKNITSDESGIGSMVCKKDNRTIEYIFKNNSLIGIKDNVTVKLIDQETADEYLNLKRIYDEKASLMGSVSKNEEGLDGFVFTADMDLENYNIPESLKDYDYYSINTLSKVIHYAEIGKGFDCE